MSRSVLSIVCAMPRVSFGTRGTCRRSMNPRVRIIGIVTTVKVEEGSLYRLGQVTIEGADHVSAADIRAMLPLSQGEVAAANSISKWLFEDLKKSYADRGYMDFTASLYRNSERQAKSRALLILK